ncbi:MAG: hypothetical protein GX149_00765 [Acholeplasmataceae bacterium]|nr:hypothetical protein [Acholeplasmataceae bacterium]
MTKKKQKNQISFFQKYRILTITLILFFIVIPVIFIPSVYIYQVASSKHVLFDDPKAKAISVAEQDYFSLDFSLTEIVEPNSENKNGLYKFKYEITRQESINELSDINVQLQLAVKHDKYTEISEEKPYSMTQMNVNFNFDMDKSALPFLRTKLPVLYVKIAFNENLAGLGSTPKVLILKVPYDSSKTIVTPQ